MLTLEFTGRGASLAHAARDAAARGGQVRRALTAAGVPADSLFSRGFVGYYWDERTQIEVRSHPAGFGRMDTVYAFRDVIVARVRDMKRIGAVIDTPSPRERRSSLPCTSPPPARKPPRSRRSRRPRISLAAKRS
ncbi:MAG: hypothetical protein H0T68_11395 [Gemmatimonadales bacterium]|nr:hypothetical protein [Gemmatimonadales bacterium]